MSREIKTYILIVDGYRRPERQRNTQGRYRVGAKSKKEAIKLLRDKIKFGSIQVLCEWNPERDNENHTLQKLGYKEIVKEKFSPEWVLYSTLHDAQQTQYQESKGDEIL